MFPEVYQEESRELNGSTELVNVACCPREPGVDVTPIVSAYLSFFADTEKHIGSGDFGSARTWKVKKIN